MTYMARTQTTTSRAGTASRELFADGSQRGHFSFGPIGFVVGAAIGAAIGDAIEHAHAYEMCMVMKGYTRESH